MASDVKKAGWIERVFGRKDDGAALYAAIVAAARAPHWYVAGGVEDSIDGRFDMIAAILSLVLLRIEREPAGAALGVALAERFVDDMDPQLREIGIGDVVVGKHVGKMMSMLGGRLGAYRAGLSDRGLSDRELADGVLAAGSLDTALVRNLYRDRQPEQAALDHVRMELLRLDQALATTGLDTLAAGRLPA